MKLIILTANIISSLFFRKTTHPAPSVYQCEDAVRDGHKHLTEALNAAVNNHIFNLSAIGKFIIYLANAVLLLPITILQPLIGEISTHLFQCAGTKAAVTPQEREKLWTRFHLFTIQDNLSDIWNRLFFIMPIQRNSEAETIFIQNIQKKWYSVLLRDRNDRDFPAVAEDISIDPITENEQNVIRYVAGFIAFKLKRFYSKYPLNRSAQHIVAIIQDWRVTKGGNGANFLSYSTKWIDFVDRGGLFHISDSVFCFFGNWRRNRVPMSTKCTSTKITM